MPNRLGGLRSCASLASASWASLNQIGLGVRARQLRDMPPAYSRNKADFGGVASWAALNARRWPTRWAHHPR